MSFDSASHNEARATPPVPAAPSQSLVAANARPPVAYDFQNRGFQENESVRFSLKLLGLVRKHWMLIGVICALFAFGGLAITFLMPRVYTAVTTIQIDREAAKVVRTQDATVERSNDPQFYMTQYELLKSRALAERVVSVLSLADDKEFMEVKKSIFASLFSLFQSKEEIEPTNAKLQRQAVGMVQAATMISPVPGSRIVRVSFSANSPAVAQRVAAGLAENFIAMTLDRRFGASSYARSFLEEKLAQVKLKLEDSEKQVVAYAQQQGIVNVDDKASVAAANLKALNESLSAATADRIKKEQVWLQAQTSSALDLPQALEDKLIERAREKQAELKADYQDKLRLMKPDFPEMTQIKAQLAEYDRQIKGQINLVKRSIKAQYETALEEENSFRRKMEALKTEVLDLRSRSIQYNILQRELDTNRSLYDGLLQQYKEIGVTGALTTNNVQIIDKADTPTSPSSPRLILNIFLALALGLLVSAVTIAVREFLDDTFVVPEEVEEALGLNVLGVVPLLKKAPGGASIAQQVMEDPHSAAAEAYRSLRTTLQFSTSSGLPKVLLVVSSQPGEGKSMTSLCLSANFAQLGMRVLLIDADVRKASLHKSLGVDNAIGLSNVLTGTREAWEVVQENIIEGVTFMASGPLPPNPAELLAGPKFATLLSSASQKFDAVIIDGPPVMGLADAPLLGSIVDGALLIVDSSRTRRRMVQAAVKRLYFARTRLLGVLLNKYDAGKAGHSYGYGYGQDYGGSTYYEYGARRAKEAEAPSLTEQS